MVFCWDFPLVLAMGWASCFSFFCAFSCVSIWWCSALSHFFLFLCSRFFSIVSAAFFLRWMSLPCVKYTAGVPFLIIVQSKCSIGYLQILCIVRLLLTATILTLCVPFVIMFPISWTLHETWVRWCTILTMSVHCFYSTSCSYRIWRSDVLFCW